MGSPEKTSSQPARPSADVKHGQVLESSSNDSNDLYNLTALGYKPELRRNRSMFTLLFQSLAIAAIPYGFGGPLISAIYGGGQLAMFLGWIMVLIVDECIAISLGELASRYPTSAGPYYWSFQVAGPRYRTLLSFITGWTWLVGNWTITLSVNFGFASLLAAAVALYYPDFEWQPWHLLLIFYALCLITFVIVAFGNKFLPTVDTFCAAFTALTIFITLVCLSTKAEAGRNSPSYTLGNYDTTISGWGSFSFLIGTLPSAYTFSALGMISSMAEECGDPTTKLPKALALCVPVGGIAGLFFVIPICATMPALADILEAPLGQALPYIYLRVMGSPGGALALTVLVLVITLFCSISITVAASRCTWAFARDRAIPLSRVWSKIDERHGTPIYALALTTLVQMLLGLIYLGNSSAFNAFVSVGVIALAISYGIPISLSMLKRRHGVNSARWTPGKTIGWIVNIVAVSWIAFELILFSMPTAIPVMESTMNYASVVFVGFMAISGLWYIIHARHVYQGPPESDGLTAGS
ncbi:putative Amino acid/polyamine transporter I [Seiridium unicorne]|uniref:Amino acid/polyamine transporter I n=1 Tax=Seiridium unicorne TaxID=138068 RepID=A0ABR2USK1_9PEZI